MAQPSKFVSVNLNKSYGQPSSRSSSALGNGRPRSGSSVVGSKVSIPPPINLPSLRKDHERFNPSSATGSTSRLGGSGTGSSTMGWTKSAIPSILQDKGKDGGTLIGSGDHRAGSPYLPSTGKLMPPERAVLLRGEDFPSLRATVTKQKDDVGQKQKQKQKQKPPEEEEVTPEVQSPLDMRPHLRSSRLVTSGAPEKNEVSSRQLGITVQSQKPDGHFPGLFPIVPLSRTSDWADDERDTGLSIPERGFSRPASARDDDSRESSKGDSFGRGISGNVKDGRDVSSWRSPPQARDGPSFRDFGVDGDRMGAKASPPSRQMSKESNNGQLNYIDSARNRYSNAAAQDTPYSRRDLGYGYNNQNGRNVESPINRRVVDQNSRGRFSDLPTNQFGGDSFQNRLMSKSPFSSGDKGLSFSDPILNFGREKRPIPNSGKQYIEDAGLDSTDTFAGAPIGEVNIKVFKKKDTLKQVDFYDPVRESFEAELERVQRVQELERQRAIKQQDKALELARREQEERERLVREEEERRRRYEEQAREAAWIAEQEKLEAAKRIEEQKNAREDEKRRIFTEEERRKESARKKLLELEERIAKRKAEASLKDTRFPSAVGDTSGSENRRDVLRVSDVGEWEDGERMVESITNTAAPDVNKFFDAVSRPHSSRGQNSSFMDSGKHASNWRRDAYGNKNSSMFLLQDEENDHHISRRDAFSSGPSGRGVPRKEIRGNIGPVVRPSSRGTLESSQVMDDLRHARGNKWNNDGDVDYLNRNSDIDAEFLDNDKFGDITWGPGHSRAHAPYTERSYQNYEVDGFLPFGRSRHSLRQPRVLPPPSSTVHPSSLSYLESEMRYQHARKPDEGSYDRVYNERIQQPGITGSLAENTVSSEKIVDKNILRCDSQSSLSVSSPPASPTHLSHDDLDESEASQLLPTSVIEEQAALSDNEHVMSASEVVDTNIIATSSSDSHGEDDEWAAESHELTQLQEVYDEDDDGYQEEEEAHESTGENLDTGKEFDDMRSDVLDTTGDTGKEFDDMRSDVLDTTGEVDQVVLGFDEGVEVRISITDEFEKTCRSSKLTVGVPGGSSQELVHSGIGLDTENDFLEGTVNESSRIINETEKAVQELVKDSVSTTSYLSDNVNASGNLGASVQHAGSTGLSSTMPSTSTVQPIQPSVSTVPSQSEVPIKLQFGLFSGLPLIPSPVPAIQFGSIQMPLHPHPQVGPSIAQVHPSRPSFFQFGQLRCPPISHGIFALSPQSMSFVQRPPPSHNFMNQNQSHEGTENNQTSPESSSLNNSGDEMVSASVPMDKLVMKPVGPSQDTMEGRQINSSTDHQSNEAASQVQTGSSSFGGIKSRYGSTSASQSERHGIRDVMVKKNYRPVSIREPLLHPERSSSQFIFGEKALGGGSKDPGMVSGSRGKRFHYHARNVRPRSFFPGPETSQHTDSSSFQRRPRRNIQRTEFRVREAFDRRQNDSDGKLNYNLNASGNSAKYGKKDVDPGNSTRLTIESQDVSSSDPSSRAMISDAKLDRVSGKVVSSKQRMAFVDNLYAGKGNLRRNGSSEEYDDDAPLQCGVVQVFKQSGIEVPSDEDDFIQVRSKRQMLNDRREQREKEIKAKSRGAKIPRKNRAVPHTNADTYIPDKVVPPFVADAFNNIRSNPNITDKDEAHLFVANVSSQPLPPVVTLTPVVNVDLEKDSESLKSSHGRSVPAISNHATNFVPGLSFENKSVAFDNASMPLGSWVNADLNQQVMALTQSELDESMQSTIFDSHAASSISHEPNKLATSITTHGKTFAPSTSPLNSLLAGEKIQFGAVTSPTILPPVNQTVSSGIGTPGSGMDPKLPTSENDYTVFIDQEKCPNEPCTHIEDPEAEAAASAVAAAVISNNNEIDGNRSSAGSVPVPDTKNFSVPDASISTSGGHVTALVTGQSTPPEKSLTISLPADLSVDSSSLSLWQPLSSPQSSSGAMLSHLPSHIPFFEMNPILGGPLFAFGPHDEPAGSQAQAQRSAPFHPPMESFYGPPAGFAGPFISPGGVQCPPHMLVYNHYTPVGQYGQVGLSFMGTTFIPSAKQPDWKHSPVSPMVGVGEIDIGNLNTVSGQRNSPRIPAPIQHLAPGSPLVPMASPLTMFDMTPFQSSADLSLQTRWSHLPAPHIHSVPFSLPLQQQQQDGMPPHMFTGVLPVPVDTSTGNNQFKEPRFSIAADGNNQFSLNSRTVGVQRHGSYCGPSSLNDTNEVLKNPKSSASSVANSSESVGVVVGQSLKLQAPQKAASSGQQYLHPIGYSDQRGDGASQKSGSGGEWHRRTGYHRRSQISGSDKSVASSKMKQIYVAKSQTGGSATTS